MWSVVPLSPPVTQNATSLMTGGCSFPHPVNHVRKERETRKTSTKDLGLWWGLLCGRS